MGLSFSQSDAYATRPRAFLHTDIGKAAAKTHAVHAVAVEKFRPRFEQHVIGIAEPIGIGLLDRDDGDHRGRAGIREQLLARASVPPDSRTPSIRRMVLPRTVSAGPFSTMISPGRSKRP